MLWYLCCLGRRQGLRSARKCLLLHSQASFITNLKPNYRTRQAFILECSTEPSCKAKQPSLSCEGIFRRWRTEWSCMENRSCVVMGCPMREPITSVHRGDLADVCWTRHEIIISSLSHAVIKLLEQAQSHDEIHLQLQQTLHTLEIEAEKHSCAQTNRAPDVICFIWCCSWLCACPRSLITACDRLLMRGRAGQRGI